MTMPRCSLDVGDIKEVWGMLARLSGRERVRYLEWCCRQAPGVVPGRGVKVTTHSGTVNEAISDLQLLEFHHGLDMGRALEELNRRCRGR